MAKVITKQKNLLLYLIDHNLKFYCQNRKSYCQNQTTGTVNLIYLTTLAKQYNKNQKTNFYVFILKFTCSKK